MGFYTKLKWILGIVMVFVLIATTNLIDRNNFVRVKEAVVTLYEDRLIAKNIIYDISKAIQEKEIAVAVADSAFFSKRNAQVNNNIDRLISKFKETKLTPEESQIFSALILNFQGLQEAEQRIASKGLKDNPEIKNGIGVIKENLDELSEIQIIEGSRQLSISKRAIDTVELFTQIEIYLLIFLAIVIQIIVMYKPRTKSGES